MGKVHIIGKSSAGEVAVFDTGPANGNYDNREKVGLHSDDGKWNFNPEQVAKALKELGIPSLWQGANLWSLERYVEEFKTLQSHVREGDMYGSEWRWEDLRNRARDAKVIGNETEIARIKKDGFAKAYERAIKEAQEAAKQGDKSQWLAEIFKYAREYAEKAGIQVDEKQIAQITKQGVEGRYQKNLKFAEEAALQGDVKETKEYLLAANRIAAEGKIQPDRKRFKEIARRSLIEAYSNSFDLAQRYARGEKPGYSSQSAEFLVSDQLREAKKYADQAGLLFDEELAQKIQGRVIQKMLGEAKELAEIGFSKEAEDKIEATLALAEEKNFSVDKKAVKTIETLIASK